MSQDRPDFTESAAQPSAAMDSLNANLQENFGVNPASQGSPNLTPPPTPPPVPPAIPTSVPTSPMGDSVADKGTSAVPPSVPNLDSFSETLKDNFGEKTDYSAANRGVKDVSKKLPSWSLEPPESYM